MIGFISLMWIYGGVANYSPDFWVKEGALGSATMHHEHQKDVHHFSNKLFKSACTMHAARSAVPYAQLCISQGIRDACNVQGRRQISKRNLQVTCHADSL